MGEGGENIGSVPAQLPPGAMPQAKSRKKLSVDAEMSIAGQVVPRRNVAKLSLAPYQVQTMLEKVQADLSGVAAEHAPLQPFLQKRSHEEQELSRIRYSHLPGVGFFRRSSRSEGNLG